MKYLRLKQVPLWLRRGDTPLCPAGHLPLKGGDRQESPTCYTAAWRLQKRKWERGGRSGSLSPLEGEMAGRPEGGAATAIFPEGRRGRAA